MRNLKTHIHNIWILQFTRIYLCTCCWKLKPVGQWIQRTLLDPTAHPHSCTLQTNHVYRLLLKIISIFWGHKCVDFDIHSNGYSIMWILRLEQTILKWYIIIIIITIIIIIIIINSCSITSTTGQGLTDTVTCQIPILPSTSSSDHLALIIYTNKPIYSLNTIPLKKDLFVPSNACSVYSRIQLGENGLHLTSKDFQWS
jgi:hypothetical protein